MFGIGTGELMLLAVLALIVLGPGKLPEIMASMGRMLREFQAASKELSETLYAAMEEQPASQSETASAGDETLAEPVTAPSYDAQEPIVYQAGQESAAVSEPEATSLPADTTIAVESLIEVQPAAAESEVQPELAPEMAVAEPVEVEPDQMVAEEEKPAVSATAEAGLLSSLEPLTAQPSAFSATDGKEAAGLPVRPRRRRTRQVEADEQPAAPDGRSEASLSPARPKRNRIRKDALSIEQSPPETTIQAPAVTAEPAKPKRRPSRASVAVADAGNDEPQSG